MLYKLNNLSTARQTVHVPKWGIPSFEYYRLRVNYVTFVKLFYISLLILMAAKPRGGALRLGGGRLILLMARPC